MRGTLVLLIGAVVFVAITFFEQLPLLGWLGGAVSVAAWIVLTRAYASPDGWSPVRYGIRIGAASAIGAVTGSIGALTAWLAQTGNLFGLATPPGDRFGAAFGFAGASLGLLYWPVVGALVCAVTAFVLAPRPS